MDDETILKEFKRVIRASIYPNAIYFIRINVKVFAVTQEMRLGELLERFCVRILRRFHQNRNRILRITEFPVPCQIYQYAFSSKIFPVLRRNDWCRKLVRICFSKVIIIRVGIKVNKAELHLFLLADIDLLCVSVCDGKKIKSGRRDNMWLP